MKKIKSKILLGLGAMTTLVTTGSVVLSCGNSNSNKDKVDPIHQGLEGITADMVKTAITTVLKPADENPAPDAPKNNEFTNLSINGFDDVSIIVQDWGRDTTFGSVSFKITSISKDAESVPGDKLGSITISGFESQSYDQKLLNGVTKQMITDAIINYYQPSPSKVKPHVPPQPTDDKYTNMTLNKLDGVSISISNWLGDANQGFISFAITSIDKGNATVDGGKFGSITIDKVFDSQDQDALNGITSSDMVKDAITAVLPPDINNPAPDAPIGSKFTVKINGLSDVSITVNHWERNSIVGAIKFGIVSIDKGTAHIDGAKFGDINISGFKPISTSQFKYQDNIGKQSVSCTTYTQSKKYLVGTTTSGLWMSSDDGVTFSQVNIFDGSNTWNINSVLQATDGTIFVSAFNNGLFRSNDDGGTFTKVDDFFGHEITNIYQASNGYIYVGTLAGLYWASNAKANFSQYSLLQGWSNITSIYEISGGTIYVGVTGGFCNLYKFRPGQDPIETSWKTIAVISKIYQASNKNIYLGTDKGLYITTDGATFSKISSDPVGAIWEIPSSGHIENIFFVAFSTTGLWVTKNGNLAQATTDIPATAVIQSIYEAPNEYKLFVGTSAGLYTTTDYGIY